MNIYENSAVRKVLVISGLCLLFLGGIGVGLIFPRIFPVSSFTPEVQVPRERREGFSGLINPLLACEALPTQVLLSLQNDILAQIQKERNNQQATQVSVYFQDLNSGSRFTVNEQETYIPASLLKVAMLIAYLKQADNDPQLLQSQLTYDGTQDQNNLQNIPPSQKLEAGKAYTIDDLLFRLIVYSDNNASNLLYAYGEDHGFIDKIYEDLKIIIPRLQNERDYMTSKDIALFFSVLYNSSYLSEKMSIKALEYLTQTEFKDALVKGTPGNIRVAHKFGEKVFADGQEFHDCGIVYYPDNPYVLCVMTKGAQIATLKDVIARVSSLVYTHITALPR